MPLDLKRVAYEDLNSRQQEGFNFQKVSAILADFGYVTIRLTSDWSGADFIAQHLDGVNFLKVQLKGRLTFSKKYCHKDLYICFRDKDHWYLYPMTKCLKISSLRDCSPEPRLGIRRADTISPISRRA